MKGLSLCLGLAITGCAGNTPQQNTAVTLYSVQQGLLGAQKLALVYLSQPPCAGATVGGVTCVDPVHKAQIKAASATATTALDKAVAVQAAAGSPELVAVAAAVSALTAAVPLPN